MMQRQMMAKNSTMNSMYNMNNMPNVNMGNSGMNQNTPLSLNSNPNNNTNNNLTNPNPNPDINTNSSNQSQNTNPNMTQNQSSQEINQNMYTATNPYMNKNPNTFPYNTNNIPNYNPLNTNFPTAPSNNTSNMTIPPMISRYPPYPMMNQMRPMMYPNNMMMNPTMSQMYQQQNPMNMRNQSQNSSENIKDMINEAISKLVSQNTTTNNEEDNDLSSLNEDTQSNYEKDFSLEEENLKNIWGGFLTKNKKDRVCVDAYQIRNECSEFLNNEYNLNVSHRTQIEDIMKRPIIGIIAFSPQNATQCEIFLDYINYFNEKNRVGVINLKNQMILYLVPPSDFSRKFYQNPKKHLLGIFVNSTAEPKSYVDMNNLSLPPPVISLTEKRQLLKQQKKNYSSEKNVANTSNQSVNQSNEALSELTKLLGNMDQDKLGKYKFNFSIN